jgi:hypothetical protein
LQLIQKGEVLLPLLSQSVLLDASGTIKTLLLPLSLLQVPLLGMSSIHMLTPLLQEKIGLYFNTLDNYARSIPFSLPMIPFKRFLSLVAPPFGHVTLPDEITS